MEEVAGELSVTILQNECSYYHDLNAKNDEKWSQKRSHMCTSYSHRVAVKYLATTAKVSLGDEAHLQKEDVLREPLDGFEQEALECARLYLEARFAKHL